VNGLRKKLEKFRRTSEHLVYQNTRIQLFDDDVIQPDGTPGKYVRLCYHDNPTGAVIVPRMPDGRLLLLKIYRYAVDELSIEFPRGGGHMGERVLDVARRELRTETGLNPVNWRELGYFRPDTAIVMTEVGVLLAELGATAEGECRPQEEEGISDILFIGQEEVRRWACEGRIRDGFTLGALGLLWAHETS